ncbi:unnamed protein product, partial [Rotaria sordida]
MYVARTFVTVACIEAALAAVCAVLGGLGRPGGYKTAAKILAIVTLFVGIVGVGVGISFTNGGGATMDAGAIMGIIALVLNLVGSILAFLIQ